MQSCGGPPPPLLAKARASLLLFPPSALAAPFVSAPWGTSPPLKHGAAIDGALVSLLSDFALSQREEMLTEAETGACVPFFPVLPFADPTLASLSRQPREPGRSRDFELQRHVSCS